jgi:hypothetical protein
MSAKQLGTLFIQSVEEKRNFKICTRFDDTMNMVIPFSVLSFMKTAGT